MTHDELLRALQDCHDRDDLRKLYREHGDEIAASAQLREAADNASMSTDGQ